MNSKERVRRAIAHIEPDRVPVFELTINSPAASDIMGRQMYVGFGGRLCGKIFSEWLMEDRAIELTLKIFQDTAELYSHLELDIFPLPPLPLTNENVEAAGDNAWKYTDPNSGLWRIIRYNPESDYHSEIDSEIKRKGVDALRRHVEAVEESSPFAPADADALGAVLGPLKERFFILGLADILFPTDASWLPLFLETMALEPELAERYLEATTTAVLQLIDVQAQAGVDGFIGGTDFAHTATTLVSPAMFRRFIFPQLRRVTARCREHGLPFFKHTDGNIRAIEEEFLLGCGFAGYHAIEPSAGMDIIRLKGKYGDRITLLGNIDCGELLTNGSEKEISAAVKNCIDHVAPGGGYVLSSSNSIHSGIPAKNFLAMLRAAREYGIYPIKKCDA